MDMPQIIVVRQFERIPHSNVRQDRPLGSAIWRIRQHTFAERVKVRQENMTATWGSAISTLSKVLAFREIILLNLFWVVLLRLLSCGTKELLSVLEIAVKTVRTCQ